MEIRYIRKLMTSHMVVEQIACLSEWEEKMISHASLPGILFAECICEDGNSNLWYDITSKQSLDVVLEGRSLDYGLLCQILMGIYEAAERLEGILLKAENILLLPESVFLDYERKQIYLCYYPHNTMPITDAFLQLMEYLLTKLAHEDEKAVELAYGIYEQAVKREWSLHQLKKSISLVYQEEESMSECEMPEATMSESEMPETAMSKCEMPKTAMSKVARSRNRNFSDEKSLEFVTENIVDADTFWEKCMRRMREILWGWLSGEIHIFPPKKARVKTMPEEEERFVFVPEDEPEPETISRPTVLLSQLNKPIEGILRYEGSGNCENLVVEGEEYLIGSDRICDGHIPSDTVSRRHARISKIGDVYMIEDLNSSNGTYVGGELLNYKTKVSLQKNEIVIFADEKFRFI